MSQQQKQQQDEDIDMDPIFQKPMRVVEIKTIGNNRTRDSVIVDELRNVMNAKDVATVSRNLMVGLQSLKSLEIFESVTVHCDLAKDKPLDHSEDCTYADVTVVVKEKRILQAKAETYVEASGSEGGVETGINLRNPFGFAEQINTSFSYGSKSSGSASLIYSLPRFRRLPIRLEAVTGYTTSSRLLQSSYDEKIQKAELRLKHMNGNHDIVLGTNWRDILPSRNPQNLYEYTASGLIIAQAKPSVKNSIQYTYTNDSRNHPFGPSRGSFLRFSTELAGFGGDVHFSKTSLKVQQFWPVLEYLIPDTTMGVSFSTGFMVPLQTRATEVADVGGSSSISDRYWLGGPMEFRGFCFKGVGPRTNPKLPGAVGGDSLGGDMTWSVGYSLYLPFPHKMLHDAGMRTHLFANAGNLCAWETSFRTLILGTRVSCGGGIVFPLAIGRIEANYSFALRANSRDQQKRFQLGFGLEFM